MSLGSVINQSELNSSCNFNIMSLEVPDHRVAVITISAIMAITATLFNFPILYSIWKTPSLHNPSYILIANLALTDIVFGAVVLPLKALSATSALMKWEHIFCDVWMIEKAIGYWVAAVSLFTITFISVDRLLAVKLMNRYRTVVTLKRTATGLIIGWIGGGMIALFPLFSSSHVSVNKLVIITATIESVLLISLTVCYSMAFHSLKKLSSTVSSTNAPSETTSREQQSSFNVNKYRRSLNTMLLVVVCIMLFYLQYVFIAISAQLMKGGFERFSQDTSSILRYKLLASSEVIVGINCLVDPLLYMWRMTDLRRAVAATLKSIFGLNS